MEQESCCSIDCSSYEAAHFPWKTPEKRQARTTCARHKPVSRLPPSYATPVESLWSEKRAAGSHTLSTSARQDPQEVEVILACAALDLAQVLHAVAGVHHRCVIAAAERIADLRKAVIREFPGERHRNLARPRDRAAAALREEIRDADLVVLGDGFLDVFHRDEPLLGGQQVLERLAGELERHGPAGESRGREHAPQRALQFADIRANPLRDEEGDFLWQVTAGDLGF